MHKNLIAAATGAALLALTACGEPDVVTVDKHDPMAEALKNAGPVEPPPMIQDSRVYRCADNSLVYIDFMSNDTVLIRNERGQPPIATLTAEGGNPPYTAEGYSVSANAGEIRYTAPGKGAQTCSA